MVLYYNEFGGEMREEDVIDVYKEFRRASISREHKVADLDVMLHTVGGDPHTGYRIAQIIRGMVDKVTFLIPEYAYSAGTLTCMCGNDVRLADGAVLSPIDITFVPVGSPPAEPIELMSIDYYIQFVTSCRHQIESMLQQMGSSSSTNVECPLLVEMVKQVKSLNIGRFWRARTLTGYYAEILLLDYMFSHLPNKKNLKDKVIRLLLSEYPTHDFRMDYHICKKIGLLVEEMSVDESDKTRELLNALNQVARQDIICRVIGDGYKAPFIRLYQRTAQRSSE